MFYDRFLQGLCGRSLARVNLLFVVNVLGVSFPFFRMLILTRTLDLGELGLSSAIAAAYGLCQLSTDININRFVYSRPREEYEEALASAHGLAIVRGCVVGAITLALAPLLAWGFGRRSDTGSFAFLALIIVIASFEDVGYRVAERDYHFLPFLKVVASSSALGLALAATFAFRFHSHWALVASLLGSTIGVVATSQFVATVPYRARFFTPLFKSAFRFGYPLVLNGLGLALATQADRFLVGMLLDLKTLGVYSVVMLATAVPMSLVFGVIGTLNLANFYHARESEERFRRTLRLNSITISLVAAVYSVGIVLLTNSVVPRVFGHSFVVSNFAVLCLALSAFFRIVRTEPFTSLMLHQARTKRLAIGNLTGVVMLIFMFIVGWHFRSIDSIFVAKVIGEINSGLIVAFILSRTIGLQATMHVINWFLFSLILVFLACAAAQAVPDRSALMSAIFCLIFCVCAGSLFFYTMIQDRLRTR